MRAVKRRSRATRPARARRPGSAEARSAFGLRTRFRNGPLTRFIRSVRSGFTLRRPMLLFSAVLVLAAAGAGLVAGGHIASASAAIRAQFAAIVGTAGFTVAEISIRGNAHTDAGAIFGALGFAPGDAMFGIDPAAARKRLLEFPWVADAEVRRRYPNTVAVVVVEKLPYALWKGPAGVAVIERSGEVITTEGIENFTHLPLLFGEGAPQAGVEIVEAVRLHRAVSARLRAAEHVSGRRWNLHLDGGVVVKLPELGMSGQVGELERLIVEKGILERDIEMIDLRFADSYIFRLRNGESQPVKRERPA